MMAVEAECTECGQPVEATVSDGPVQVQMDSARVTAGDVEGVWDEEGPEGVADWIRLMASVARASSTSSSTPAGVDVRDVSGLADRFRELGLHAAVALLDDCPAVETARPSGGVGQPDTAELRIPTAAQIVDEYEASQRASADLKTFPQVGDRARITTGAREGYIGVVDQFKAPAAWHLSHDGERIGWYSADELDQVPVDRSPRSWSLPAPPPDDVTAVHVGGVRFDRDLDMWRDSVNGEARRWSDLLDTDTVVEGEPQAGEPPRFERGFYRLARNLSVKFAGSCRNVRMVAVSDQEGDAVTVWTPGHGEAVVSVAALTAAGAEREEER